jgi:hypothetical protein
MPDELVAGHEGIRDAALTAPDPVVGSAEARHLDPDQHLTGTGLGVAGRLDTQIAGTMEDRSLHPGKSTPLGMDLLEIEDRRVRTRVRSHTIPIVEVIW